MLLKWKNLQKKFLLKTGANRQRNFLKPTEKFLENISLTIAKRTYILENNRG